jgi:hypothetical protein
MFTKETDERTEFQKRLDALNVSHREFAAHVKADGEQITPQTVWAIASGKVATPRRSTERAITKTLDRLERQHRFAQQMEMTKEFAQWRLPAIAPA